MRILGKKTNWSGTFLSAVLFEVESSNGARFNWEAFQRQNCTGIVAMVPITVDGSVIVVKQFRPPVGKYVIEFPAGLSDKGEESLAETAKRELREETGCVAGRLIPIATGPLSSGASTEVLTVYAALDVVF
ncbi:MAG: NUDIX hydrolase, partial [Candidatus Magnetominusculus sp. LBB02]|nr:NUDIX hydrolase [Candidatus Magnetominusculus sp. LBB02]